MFTSFHFACVLTNFPERLLSDVLISDVLAVGLSTSLPGFACGVVNNYSMTVREMVDSHISYPTSTSGIINCFIKSNQRSAIFKISGCSS